MSDIIPIFKSHYSISRSILTLEVAGKSDEIGPKSIFDIAKDNNLSEVFLVEDTMTGLYEAYKNSQKSGVNLRFGLNLTICDNIDKKDEESLPTEHRLIVFIKNSNGYKDLIKISTKAFTDGFYYTGRIDLKTLESLWTDNLAAAIPFYDSFIFNNTLTYSSITADIKRFNPVIFLEDKNLPFDSLIRGNVLKYAQAEKIDTQEVHTIYYKDKADFKSYQTFRCIGKRSNLGCPNLDFFCSDSFSFEAYKERINNQEIPEI